MKIIVKGFFSIKNALDKKGEIEMEVGNLTIREVLTELSHRYGKKFKDEVFDLQTNEFTPQNQILINGRHYRYLANGLDMKLSKGGMLVIFPLVAGG
jgi:MoaD family protein